MRNSKHLIIVVVILIALAGCSGNPARGKIEKSVEANLPTLIGPADSYTIRAYGSTLKMVSGKLDGLDITGTGVQLPSGIRISTLLVKVRKISLNTKTQEIKSIRSTEYIATVTEEELSKYIAKQYPSIPGFGVGLKEKAIQFTAKPGISVVRIGVQGEGDLQIRNERILALDLKKLKVAGIPTPAFALNLLEGKVGTIFDAKDLGFDAKIKSVAIKSGTLTLRGTVDLMEVIKKQGFSIQRTPRT